MTKHFDTKSVLFLVVSIICCTFAPAFWQKTNILSGLHAALAELVDAPDLGSGSSQSEGSSPLCRTS